MKRRQLCHIKRAWPEHGHAKALCGADPGSMVHGGLLVADCKRCLEMARNAGMHLGSHHSVFQATIEHMRKCGVEV